MIILDANVLIYAHHPQLRQHERSAKWLELALSEGSEAIGLVWQAVSGFLRISTNSRVFAEPMTIAVAKNHIDKLLSHPLVHQIHTTDEHWKIYSALITELNIAGDIVTDAHIASIAIEHKAAVATTDKDFRRFSDYIRIIDPLKAK